MKNICFAPPGIINFHEKLISNLKAFDELPLPKSWFRFLSSIQERHEKILTWAETMQIFEDVLAEMEQSVYMLQGSAEKSLEMVLRYLHVTGNGLKLSRDYIYTMNKVTRGLFY